MRHKFIWLAILPIAVAGLFFTNVIIEAFAPKFDPHSMPLVLHEVGQGPVSVLLLHGLAGSAHYWLPRIGPQTANEHILIPDLLGFGSSPKPKANYDVDDHIHALEQLLQSYLPMNGQTVVIGHSLGAILALNMIERHPSWFKAGVGIGMPVFDTKEEAAQYLGKASTMYKAILEEDTFMQLSCYIRDLYRIPWLSKYFELPTDVYLEGTRHSWNSLSGTLLHTIVNPQLKTIGKRLTKPFLLIHGDRDEIAPVQSAKSLAATNPLITVQIVPGGDHQIPLTHTSAMWEQIQLFTKSK